jgi:hypothetical protein
MDVDCPIKNLPGTCLPVDGERHIGIDQGIKAFAICVVDKFQGRSPILQAADLHNFKDVLPTNFKATDLFLVLQTQTHLISDYMDISKLPADPNGGKIERVVIHLEQVSIENPHFEAYTKDLGELLQNRSSDMTKLIVKLSSSKVSCNLSFIYLYSPSL